jgi:hypothetical protein
MGTPFPSGRGIPPFNILGAGAGDPLTGAGGAELETEFVFSPRGVATRGNEATEDAGRENRGIAPKLRAERREEEVPITPVLAFDSKVALF